MKLCVRHSALNGIDGRWVQVEKTEELDDAPIALIEECEQGEYHP